MSNLNDFDYDMDESPQKRNIYSLHLDKARMAIFGIIAAFIISGTFFIGLFVGESKEKVYNSNYGVSLKADQNKKDNSDFSVQLPQKKTLDSGLDLNHNSNDKNQLHQNNHQDSPLYKFDQKNSSDKQHKTIKTKKKNRVIGTSRTFEQPFPTKKTFKRKKIKRTSKRTKVRKTVQRKHNRYHTRKGYQIQIASFTSLKRAKKAQHILRKHGFRSYISKRALESGKTGYRVSFGAGKKLSYLEKKLPAIRRKTPFHSAFIIKM